MSTSNKKIALLTFALSSQEEIKSKPFLAQKKLAKSLNGHIKKLSKSSGLPVFNYDETKQVGNSFGARFSNAIQSIMNRGYDAVITIGNDSPELNLNHIRKAEKTVKNGSTVLGPSHDGGFYLLGITKENFDYNTFLNYSWNTTYLFDEVIHNLEVNDQNYVTLQKLNDIDLVCDLEKLCISNISTIELRKIIQSIRVKNPAKYSYTNLSELDCIFPRILNKGSPFSLAI